MSSLWEMLQDPYAESSSPQDAFVSPAVKGSASDRQLSYIEKLSGGSGDFLAEQRFGKSLMELSTSEAALLIQILANS